jgi:Nicotinamide mononucleotide transporter.
MDYLEIIGTLVGLLYLYLEYKASIYLWFAGVVMPFIYIYVFYAADSMPTWELISIICWLVFMDCLCG